ncbi:DNA polymerase delta subunit 3 [Acyrthosiphon pisum]|uniref:DNA polymerase delta subunit 3 n=1 Tax=Acyrthosiphon pisum TaxID=7029 RepID=A0A8R1W0R4_ACYPI|nr:DNA polymerase delta subunit 3 [Acyrthosiphon pisum]|eukprot:XP_001947535.2 PREDICTED: DNA polymerase delta subunit 3 [Acyrthosiphon pisum]
METKIIVEQLEDKQQIVTYKYLTEKLDIHPNKAKQLLKDYVSKLTADHKYSITIAIGGTLKENDEFCIVLAYDDHVETMHRRFKQIDFEHVYSIQPINRFDDMNNALHLVDNSLNNVNLPSSIKRKEIGNDSIPEQRDAIEMEINLPLTKQTNLSPNQVQNHKNETTADIKLDKTQKEKNGLDFFAKNNNTNNTKLKEIEKKVIPKKNNSNFFTKFKSSNKNPCTTNDSADSKNKVSTENITKKDTKIIDVEPPKNVQKNSTSADQEKNQKKEKKKKENVNKSKSKNSLKVKRKRIQTFDSSDEEINSEEEDMKRTEHVLDSEDDVDFVQPTPPRPTPRENRKKEKQTTTSTFIDDDGFVHTTKEVKIVETECVPLLESIGNDNNSESKELNVEPVIKKIKISESDSADKKKNKNKKSKNSSSQGMKQSSLTSFFKTK